MVDFKKLREKRKTADPIKPYDIFKRLAPEGINDLWHSQQIILDEWFQRRNEKDLVIKLNTGGGKTIIGLLIAQSIVNETKGSVLYLCPTNQLVSQTFDKAKQYGIKVAKYVSGKGIPIGFKSGNCIMVATYSALFNGMSTFGLEGDVDITSVEGIIFDDAHTSGSIVRDQFTLKVEYNDKNSELYDEIVGIFRNDFKDIERIGIFDDVTGGKDSKVLEVPYWAWKAKEIQIRNLLKDKSDQFKFQWKLLRDNLKYCHCLIDTKEISITPIYPLVNLFPTFINCKKRIYMSATLANDSTIITTFDADYNSVLNPIEVDSNVSMGERMILAPALMNINADIKQLVKDLCKVISEKYGVIILTPSSIASNQWTEIGEFAAKSAEVLAQVEKMTKHDSKGPFIWANRYDGIDLPADTCRLLIMAGKPGVMNAYDRYIASVLNGSQLINSIVAHRIEQGIGRATRGAGDYCVILLEGDDIITWISERSNLNLLSPSTRAQLELGNDISKEITNVDELYSTIKRCYVRDPEWTSLHAEMLADISNDKISYEKTIKEAAAERRFFNYYLIGDLNLAKQELNNLIKDVLDIKLKSWLKQILAKIYNDLGERDKARILQKEAYKGNNQLFKPLSDIPYEYLQEPSNQSKKIVDSLKKYSYRKGLISEISNITSKLTPSSSANQFENSMKQLGNLIGFECQRPEYVYGEGPDVLWRIESKKFLIIECKSKKKTKNPLNKKEHGQLLESFEWFKEKYPGCKGEKVSLHPTDFVTEGAHTNETLVFTLKSLNKLIVNVNSLFNELCYLDFDEITMNRKCDELLKKFKLLPDSFINEYCEKFKSV
ncbi:MAG: DEAD/DEAH box helicase family protein [Clostridium sp.]|jgi:replicative superfamily II helicase|uniref:DEAD/DEAH box helicase family protein n=1 Tax=Clostridium sp. TaxID=1506 RepID=UPI0025B7AB1A|nr:DEAD/DEAH box helicase family protein [Clostridium sp.]MCH3965733.1 DEAD/DEAH box helicase family protein [Clostridium sp.]MCI2201300.1 DEAD/DEAH box helicase family protein [Clostridium sp.]